MTKYDICRMIGAGLVILIGIALAAGAFQLRKGKGDVHHIVFNLPGPYLPPPIPNFQCIFV